MQTFLPYPGFTDTAYALDYRRLGKQRVEVKQILLALRKTTGGWVNHPAVRMWRGSEMLLAEYGATMCREWIARGYNDSLLGWFEQYPHNVLPEGEVVNPVWFNHAFDRPSWLGDPALHRSHQSNLLRKDPDFYGVMFPGVPDDLPYVWPVP